MAARLAGDQETPWRRSPAVPEPWSVQQGGYHALRRCSVVHRRGGPAFDNRKWFREFIDYNIEAEALGFHSLFVVEHYFTGDGQVSATFNLLTRLGAHTPAAPGHRGAQAAWHNPMLLAGQAATLDLLSGDRPDFGLGMGHRYNEFASFRVPMEVGPTASTRSARWPARTTMCCSANMPCQRRSVALSRCATPRSR